MKQALVLGGGRITGSWQAGAIRALYAMGYRYDIVTGISVGALNTAGLAAFGAEWLARFWLEQVTGPEVIMRTRRWYELAYRVLTKRWDGVVDTAPLERLVRRTFPANAFAQTTMDARVGTVSLRTGELTYVPATDPAFLDAVLASTAEPAVMPLRRFRGDRCCDGGIRDITPLAQAIELGADRVTAIVCQPDGIAEAEDRWGDALRMIEREVSIVEVEILANDLRVCGWVNRMVAAGIAPEKRHVEVTVIRPDKPLPIDARSFTRADVAAMVAAGDKAARDAMICGGLPSAA